MRRPTSGHYVCLPCRASFKQDGAPPRAHLCPHCGQKLIDAGYDVAIPRRTDKSAWRALEAMLRVGLTSHSCGCGGSGFRPRTSAEVWERRRVASRPGLAEQVALKRYDPLEAEEGEG
jgi:hypothetical protein